jgi:hypothetical protein
MDLEGKVMVERRKNLAERFCYNKLSKYFSLLMCEYEKETGCKSENLKAVAEKYNAINDYKVLVALYQAIRNGDNKL